MKPSFQEHFCAMRATKAIEKDIKDKELRMVEATGIDVTMIFEF